MQYFTCIASPVRRHTRGRDCEAESSFPSASALGRISSSELRDGTRDSVFPAPLARAHWLALNHAGSPSHIVHQRTLTRNGNVPISSSVQDFCDSWKITCSISHALRQRSVGILGKETAKQNLSSAELRDGTRDSVLALNHMQCIPTCSASHASQMRWLFVGFA